MKRLATLAVLAAASLWGLMGLFVRRLSSAGLGSIELVQLRVLCAGLLIGLYLLLFRRGSFRIRLRDAWCFLGTGLGSILFFSYCYYQCMRYCSLSVAGVLLYTAPVFVMLFSIPVFRERLTARKLLALCMAVLGCVLVSGAGGHALPWQGLLYGLGAGLGYALYSVFARLASLRGYDSWTITFYTFLVCGLGCVPLVDVGQIVRALCVGSTLAWVVAMGIVTGLAAYLLYTWGLGKLEPSRASILATVEPVVATLVGFFVFHETLSLTGVLGILLVLGAIAVLSVQKVNNS